MVLNQILHRNVNIMSKNIILTRTIIVKYIFNYYFIYQVGIHVLIYFKILLLLHTLYTSIRF